MEREALADVLVAVERLERELVVIELDRDEQVLDEEHEGADHEGGEQLQMQVVPRTAKSPG